MSVDIPSGWDVEFLGEKLLGGAWKKAKKLGVSKIPSK